MQKLPRDLDLDLDLDFDPDLDPWNRPCLTGKRPPGAKLRGGFVFSSFAANLKAKGARCWCKNRKWFRLTQRRNDLKGLGGNRRLRR